MPKGAKKRAKLKKQQQEGHPDGGGANNTHNGNGNGAGDDNATSRDGDHGHHLRIPPHVPHADVSEESMESSEEMVTPRAASSEADDEERKAASERTVEVDSAPAGEAGEEVMVDALSPETGGQELEGKGDAEVEVHAVAQEQEAKDVVVDEAPEVQGSEVADSPVVEITEVKREVAKVHPVHEPELKAKDVVVVRETPVVLEPDVKDDGVAVAETVLVQLMQEPETKDGSVVVKDSAEVSQSRDFVDVHTTEVVRGPVVAVAASGRQATWWNCCGLFDAFAGSER